MPIRSFVCAACQEQTEQYVPTFDAEPEPCRACGVGKVSTVGLDIPRIGRYAPTGAIDSKGQLHKGAFGVSPHPGLKGHRKVFR